MSDVNDDDLFSTTSLMLEPNLNSQGPDENLNFQSGPEVASYNYSIVVAPFLCYCGVYLLLIAYLLFIKEPKYLFI